MKVSIITVTYNSGKTLRDTFNSVLSQSFTNIEYIVVDGASTDNTLDIIREYEPQFRGRMSWISEPDHGIYDAMNKGLRMATGDVIGVLNSDDLYYDQMALSRIVSSFTPEVEAVFSNLYFVSADNTNQVVRAWKGSPYVSFRTGWQPAHPTFYVRREVYEKYGLFDTSFEVSADFELMLRFIEKKRIKTRYVDSYSVRMRVGGESSGIRNIIKGNKNILRAFKKNGIDVPPFYVLRRLSPKVMNLLMYKLHLKRHV